MSHIHPNKETPHASSYRPFSYSKPTPYQARPEFFGAFSVVDGTKDKALKAGNGAVKEFEKASVEAQAKAGHIELYSGKYYAACTFGGMMACVCRLILYQHNCHSLLSRASLTPPSPLLTSSKRVGK